MSAYSKTKTKKKSKTPTKTSSKTRTIKKTTKRRTKLQMLLESQKSKTMDIEKHAFGMEITYNSNDELTGIRRKKQLLSDIIWSRYNSYLNIPNFRSSIWQKVPDNAYVICVQYRDNGNNPADVQIGITGTCKKYSENWKDCMVREIKEETGLELKRINNSSLRLIKELRRSQNPQIWHWQSINSKDLHLGSAPNKDEREDDRALKVGAIIWTENVRNFLYQIKRSFLKGGLNRLLDDNIIQILCVPKLYITNNLSRAMGRGRKKRKTKRKKRKRRRKNNKTKRRK